MRRLGCALSPSLVAQLFTLSSIRRRAIVVPSRVEDGAVTSSQGLSGQCSSSSTVLYSTRHRDLPAWDQISDCAGTVLRGSVSIASLLCGRHGSWVVPVRSLDPRPNHGAPAQPKMRTAALAWIPESVTATLRRPSQACCTNRHISNITTDRNPARKAAGCQGPAHQCHCRTAPILGWDVGPR